MTGISARMKLFFLTLGVAAAAAAENSTLVEDHEEYMHVTCTAASDGFDVSVSLECNSTCGDCEEVKTGKRFLCSSSRSVEAGARGTRDVVAVRTRTLRPTRSWELEALHGSQLFATERLSC